MEIPAKLGIEGEDEEEEYDSVFYEDIEAPKFVDLTAPDAARPTDDPSWFCLRIGCDQHHEQVDPDALHRSFFMRVMAARSPNVRLQKAISRRNQSSMLPKCPHSAPAKPPRSRITRLSTATGAAEKAAKPRLKNHRICSLRDSPTRTKAARIEAATGAAEKAAKPRLKNHRICSLRDSPTRTKAARIEASSARKKALTTPRSKTVRPRQEPFLSVKHQKEPVATAAAAGKGAVVKALFMSTRKKDAGQTPAKSQAPVSEVCSKMRKLNLACREVPSRYLSQLSTPKIAKKCKEMTAAKSVKRAQESRTNGKKKILGRSVKCADDETGEGNRSGRENIAEDENSCAETARSNEERKEVLQESRIEVEALQPDNSDDNKENVSYGDQPTEQIMNGSHREGENMKQLENNENVPQKVAKMQNKVYAEQGGKLKKTTIQRPFRLRTDERQVLKEANPERIQTLAENNSMAVLKDGNRGVTQGRCPDGKGRDKPTCGEKQKKPNTHTATGQLGGTKTVLNSTRRNNVRHAVAKGKAVEKSERVARIAPSTRTAASGFMAPSQIGKERKTSVKTSRLQAAAA